MIIRNIKINGFGKLENKEFQLNKGINLITGKNECGKSTLAQCIQSMFFGVSRTKNGKSISNYEKYKPWNDIPFTAKINYALDNGEEYEVYRDFNKRNTKIFNSNLDDISSNYSIDKNKNSNFFTEQTNISEDIFNKTAIIHQQEVKLNKTDQNVILQKISNLVSTGNDTISFNKLVEKLNRKQLDEIGTTRSTERPLNIVLNKIKVCEDKLKNISYMKSQESSINDELAQLKQDLIKNEKDIELLKELQNIRNGEKNDINQIETIKQIINEYDNKINEADTTVKEIESKNSKKIKIGFIFLLLCVISTILFFLLNLPIPTISLSIILLFICLYFLFNRTSIPNTKEILLKAKKDKENELSETISKFEKTKLSRNDYLRNKYGDSEYLSLSYEQITNRLSTLEKAYSDARIKVNTLAINSKSIGSQMEELAEIEEQLNSLNEELSDLNFLNNSINIAKEALNEAYEEMKNNITPKFTNYLSNTISKISNGKYNQVRFNDENGLIVQLETGDYINSELLSIGTIDEMYISLRLSALKEISEEKLPIILDEAFVYFDDERLENMLNFLNEEFEQIIILSCSNREKNLLDKMEINYSEHIL